jgi:hypothetical protein
MIPGPEYCVVDSNLVDDPVYERDSSQALAPGHVTEPGSFQADVCMQGITLANTSLGDRRTGNSKKG